MSVSNKVLIACTGSIIVAVLALQQREITVIHNDIEDIKSYLVQSNEKINYTAADMKCLSENVYYEAGIEPVEGKYAVAQVTMNRMKTGHWGNNICKVVHAKAQFSWTLKKKLDKPKGIFWEESKAVARNVLNNGVRVQPLKHSLMYHATYVSPYWVDPKQRITQVGQHIFYRKSLGSNVTI